MDAVVHFDGLNEPMNPGGVACYGFVVEFDGKRMEGNGVIGAGMYGDYTTNNIAEYTGLIKALEFLKVVIGRDLKVKIYGDSQLVIFQLRGFYRVKSENVRPLYQKAVELINEFNDVEIRWVPREQNKDADEQTRKAFEGFVKENWERYKQYYGRIGWARKRSKEIGLPTL
jgi:ribonuclease HI